MKNYKIYINQQGWNLFTTTKTSEEAGFILERFDSREIHSIIVEHDKELDYDTPCTNEIRKQYLKRTNDC